MELIFWFAETSTLVDNNLILRPRAVILESHMINFNDFENLLNVQ